jgi:hypothetical protein
MTDNSQNFDNLQERNQQVLENISQLQSQEKQLYDSLDNVTLSSDQKQQIINKINEISQMRMNMYSGMKDMYSYYQKNVTASRTTLGQEVAAIDILENELNESKRRLNLLEDQKYNKLRLVEINTYYGKRYNAHSKLMKTIVITCIPLIILAILANNGILPSNLYVFLSGLVIVIGVVFIGLQLIDMSNRDNMNWDEYNWYFDKSKAPSDTTEGTATDPWQKGSLTCIGSACCYDGSTYDDTLNICVPNSIYQQDHPDATTTDITTTSDATTETFKGMGRYAYTQSKPAFLNNTVLPTFGFFNSKGKY